MKNNKIENLIEALYSVRMTEQEKKAMQQHVLQFSRVQAIPSPYQRVSRVMFRSLSVAFMALLTIGSLSKPAAAGALPGEFLYPVKMIHEELESVTKHGSEERITHEIERTNTRIEEATELEENETLDVEKQQQLVKSIKKHTNKVKSEIQELKTHDPIKALELNHKLQNSIKSNVNRLTTKEVVTVVPPEVEAVVVNSEITKQQPVASEIVATTQELHTLAAESEAQIPLPTVNEIDIALSVSSRSVSEVPQENAFGDLLKEMEADLKEAEEEYQETEKNVTKSVITPSDIGTNDEVIVPSEVRVTDIL